MYKYLKEITVSILVLLLIVLTVILKDQTLANIISIIIIFLVFLIDNAKVYDLFIINKRVIGDNYYNLLLNIAYPFIIYLIVLIKTDVNILILMIVIILEISTLALQLIYVITGKKNTLEYRDFRVKRFFRVLVLVLSYVMLLFNNLIIIDMIALVLISYAVYLINFGYELIKK